MTDPTEDEPILGDLPELPDHVWAAALDHAFDPQAEPNVDLVPADDLSGQPAGDDLSVLDDQTALDDQADDVDPDAFDAFHDPYDQLFGGGTSEYDAGPDHGYDPGFSDTDGYF